MVSGSHGQGSSQFRLWMFPRSWELGRGSIQQTCCGVSCELLSCAVRVEWPGRITRPSKLCSWDSQGLFTRHHTGRGVLKWGNITHACCLCDILLLLCLQHYTYIIQLKLSDVLDMWTSLVRSWGWGLVFPVAAWAGRGKHFKASWVTPPPSHPQLAMQQQLNSAGVDQCKKQLITRNNDPLTRAGHMWNKCTTET